MTQEIKVKLFGEQWAYRLNRLLDSPEFEALGRFLANERLKSIVYPKKEDVFKAFKECPFESVKVVILGMDPYNNGVATGLAFANPANTLNLSPSLKTILNEVENDIYEGFSFDVFSDYELTSWAHQGVFPLNTALTVRKGEAGSHSRPWKFFTNEVIRVLNDGHSGLIFLLWGTNAKEYRNRIALHKHYILEAGHPASRCYNKDLFTGCKHFSRTNALLKGMNGPESEIKW